MAVYSDKINFPQMRIVTIQGTRFARYNGSVEQLCKFNIPDGTIIRNVHCDDGEVVSYS